ncbi:MAG: exopolysaccharide biosynthesis protein [Rickettsia endosymbiont of Bryobia graminum]|nr:exopolysaccharide biosynthesis protein [Rickettsia endosymbiont of Bryobia graminum]
MHFNNRSLDSTKISTIFRRLEQKNKESSTKVSELLGDFHENGFLLTIIFFSLPIAIPIPYPPGFTTLMGIPLLILSMQMLFGYKRVSLPSKINNYKISNDLLIKISNKVLPILKFTEKYIKPRFKFTKSIYCEQIVGLISVICSISIIIPLPLTNALPAIGIIIMSLGLLNRDGLTVLIGFATSLIGVILAILVVTASWLGLKYIFNLFL